MGTPLPSPLAVVITSASSPMPWQALAARAGIARSDVVGMDSFGASAPAAELFPHFGFSAEHCARRAAALL